MPTPQSWTEYLRQKHPYTRAFETRRVARHMRHPAGPVRHPHGAKRRSIAVADRTFTPLHAHASGRSFQESRDIMPEVMFAGPDGRLEGRYHHSSESNAPLALILHPHPLHGGTMNNRITYSMYRSFEKLGFSVMRFNFRGVGRSQGRYDGGIGEIADAAAALDWMQMVNPNSSGLWIAGYSFGAFVSMQLLMRRPEISGWISVAPPANSYDFGFLAPCPCGGLMLHGDADELVPEPSVRKLVDKLNTQKGVTIDYRVCPGADHVFASHADTVSSALEDYVGKIIARKALALAAD